jgi:hypothetical protein
MQKAGVRLARHSDGDTQQPAAAAAAASLLYTVANKDMDQQFWGRG